MIAVCIATYNHEAFIAEAIESVLSQQCDEAMRIYIGDDASTDGTSSVCRRYAGQDKRIVYIRRETNMGLVRNTIDLYRRIMADGVYGIDSPGFANCTVVFRTELLDEKVLETIEAQDFRWLDYPLYGVFYQKTKWVYLPEETAVWRDHESVSQPREAKAILRNREERCRMWKWLDTQFPGKVGYSQEEEKNYLCEVRLNLIYQFDDLSLVTPELLNDYQPGSWKQRMKKIGLKNKIFYSILRKFSQKFA